MKQYRFDRENHIHTLDDKPLMGTSKVVGVIAKPLTWWASGLAVAELGWTKKLDPRKSTPEQVKENASDRFLRANKALLQFRDMGPLEYFALLDKAYRAHADRLTKSADKGTGMHAELEAYVKDCIAHGGVPLEQSGAGSLPVRIFAAWACENVKRFLVSEGHCYSERLWTGGITDLLFEDKEGRLGIMDFKSSREAYLSQFMQIAGYDIAISENGLFDENGKLIYKPDRSIGFYAVFPFHASMLFASRSSLTCLVYWKIVHSPPRTIAMAARTLPIASIDRPCPSLNSNVRPSAICPPVGPLVYHKSLNTILT
jgi:hypothetical protein